jgi:hypothetical protein
MAKAEAVHRSEQRKAQVICYLDYAYNSFALRILRGIYRQCGDSNRGGGEGVYPSKHPGETKMQPGGAIHQHPSSKYFSPESAALNTDGHSSTGIKTAPCRI